MAEQRTFNPTVAGSMPATPTGQWSYWDSDLWTTASRPLLGADGRWLSIHYVSEWGSMEQANLFEDRASGCGDHATMYLNWWVVVVI